MPTSGVFAFLVFPLILSLVKTESADIVWGVVRPDVSAIGFGAEDSIARGRSPRAMPEDPPGETAQVDLALVVGWLCLCWVAVAVPPVNASPLRPLVAVPAALVLPGYAVLAALAPRDGDPALPSVERFALAIAGSVAVCMLVGILLLSTALPVSGVSVLALLSGVTLAGVVAAARRRGGLELPSRPTVSRSPFPALPARSEVGAVSATVALLVGVAAVAGAVGTVALLGVHEPAGHATLAVEHPAENVSITDVPVTADTPLVVTVENRRSTATTYTLVMLVERVDGEGGVNTTRRLDTDTVSLEPGDRWTKRYRPERVDGGARLAFELYRGSDPSGEDSADTRVHLWLTDAGNASSAESADVSAGVEGRETPLPSTVAFPGATGEVSGP